MRETEQSSRLGRRGLLRAGATAGESRWAKAAKAITPHVMATMVLVARDIYPHDDIADLFYIRAIIPWDAKAARDPAIRDMILDGVARLDHAAAAKHASPYLDVGWQADRVELLRGIERTEFFRTLRADLVGALYNQPEVSPNFGRDGSSAPYDSYLNRGVSGIDWLPSV